MTVSRVVNGSGPVSPRLRARVEKALKETGYVPNTVARNLRTKRTDTIGLVMPDITNPFWTTVARGVEDAANSRGYHVIFCNIDENAAKQEEYLTILLQRRIDGVLLVPAMYVFVERYIARSEGKTPPQAPQPATGQGGA